MCQRRGQWPPICWARLGSINPKGWSYCRGRNGSAPLAADVSFRVGALGMAPAWRIITGHGGQGPDLALSGSPNLDSTRQRKSLPTGRLLLLVSVAPVVPSSCRPARQPGLPARPARSATARQVLFWFLFWSCRVGRPHLAQARACLVSRLVDKDGRAWLVDDIAVRPAARSRSDPGHHTLAMSSSQHIQEVSRRARWSHLANERSISTSKGPPPAPAKARLDAMLLLGPCLFPSPPPCSHPFSLTTNC